MPVATRVREVQVMTRNPHSEQERFRVSKAKRKIIRAGRRGGKTVGIAIPCIEKFVDGRRVLYTAPTSEQTDAFWFEVKRALQPLVDTGVYKLNESERYIEKLGTQNRIKAKTAWDANSLRGDFADYLVFDEWQLTNEDAWDVVGMPMLLDNNGDAVFIYTPPSLRSTGVSKAHDPRHAAKMFKAAQQDVTGLWEAFHFTSRQNPFISQEALTLLASQMSSQTYRQEILAEDDDIQTAWLVHSKFNEALCKIKRFPVPTNWDVFSGHDFGSANPAALFGARVKLPLPAGAPAYMRLNDIVFWKEYAPGPGFSTAQHVARFKEIASGYKVVVSRGGNLNSEDEIRQGYTKEGWTILPPALEKKNSQIDRVINLEENNRIYIFGDMLQAIEQVLNCLWKLKDGQVTNEIDNEAMYHLLACMRYICSDGDFTPEAPAGQMPVHHSRSRSESIGALMADPMNTYRIGAGRR
jgi:hypothetical protein